MLVECVCFVLTLLDFLPEDLCKRVFPGCVLVTVLQVAKTTRLVSLPDPTRGQAKSARTRTELQKGLVLTYANCHDAAAAGRNQMLWHVQN